MGNWLVLLQPLFMQMLYMERLRARPMASVEAHAKFTLIFGETSNNSTRPLTIPHHEDMLVFYVVV